MRGGDSNGEGPLRPVLRNGTELGHATVQGCCDGSRMSLASLAIRFTKFYQRHWQPTTGCLYDPVCSEYAIACFEKYGFRNGVILAAERLKRCNPQGKAEFDAALEESRVPALRHAGVQGS